MGIKYDQPDTLSSKSEIKQRALSYRDTSVSDVIRIKTKLKYALVRCPQLLYALHNEEYESELFDDDGNLIEDGEWDRYLGDNIRPYLMYPEVQTKAKNYISFKVEFDEYPSVNDAYMYCEVTLVVMVDMKDITQANGIPRHDEIAAILVERLNWSNITGTQCRLISSSEGYTDSNYVTRTLVFRSTNLNNKIKNRNGTPYLSSNAEVFN